MAPLVRRADVGDAAVVARLLHDFNTEFGDLTPGTAALTERLRELLAGGGLTVLLVGEPAVGVAVLRFRPALWITGLDAYLEELYVAPAHRGRGYGRALLDATLASARDAGAVRMELGTGETDTAARALYESSGFTNLERPGGPRMLFYERDL